VVAQFTRSFTAPRITFTAPAVSLAAEAFRLRDGRA
jgi:hypothetical protein